jgi:hypothetical protein
MKWLGWTEPCSVYKCITGRKTDFCGDCDDFPCEYLHPNADKVSERPHNTRVSKLCQIAKMGMGNWAQRKAEGVKDTYFKWQFKL